MSGADGVGICHHEGAQRPRDLLLAPASEKSRSLASLVMTLRLNPVPSLPHGKNVPRLGSVFLELATQLGDMGVDRPAVDFARVSPHFLEQLASRRNLSAALEQRDEEIVFLRSQRDRLSASLDCMSSWIDLHVAEAHRAGKLVLHAPR